MIATTETAKEQGREYGIGFRHAPRKINENFVDESAFVPDEEIERRISIPDETPKIAQEVKEEKNVQAFTKLSIRSKILLGVYMASAVILSVIVAITGVIIGNKATQVAAYEGKVAAASAAVATQRAQIQTLSSDAEVYVKATNAGMTETNATKVDLVEEDQAKEASAHSNFFDGVCDWLSDLIGG